MLEPFSRFTREDTRHVRLPCRECQPAFQHKLAAFASLVDSRLPPLVRVDFPHVAVFANHQVHWERARPGTLTGDTDLYLEIPGTSFARRGCFAYIKGGSSSEPNTKVGRLAAAMQERPREFTELLTRLGPEYTLTLYARDGQGSREPKLQMSLDIFSQEMYMALQATLEKTPLPGIELHRSLGCREAEEVPGEALVEWTANAVASLAEVCAFL